VAINARAKEASEAIAAPIIPIYGINKKLRIKFNHSGQRSIILPVSSQYFSRINICATMA